MGVLLFATFALGMRGDSTLADYLRSHPVANAVVVGAETITTTAPPTGLAAFEYKPIDVGAVTVIAPAKMVRFQDDLGQSHDLYDGLPRNSKVLYLASTFTPKQWSKAAGSGIGANDLTAQQRPVFASLLPKAFRWKKYEVGGTGEPAKFLSEGTLSPGEIGALRLRIARQLLMLVALADRERTYSIRDVPAFTAAGGTKLVREAGGDDNYDSNFGVDFRREVPNALRKGDLRTENLRQMVNLPGSTTVGAALDAVARATRLRLAADVRVRGYSVSAPPSVSAGDLLNAIAVGVCGTYRQVGNRYLLVSDRVGSGSRQLLYAAYKRSAREMVTSREKEWRAAVRSSGGVDAVTWNPSDANRPNEAVLKRLSRPLKESSEFFPSSELTPELRSLLESAAKESAPFQPLRTDTVNFQANIAYQFVLPNGSPTQVEGNIGTDFQFSEEAASMAAREFKDPEVPRLKNGIGSPRSLVVSAETAEAAMSAAETAKKYGFSEIWLKTEHPEALLAAQRVGLPVRYYCRPFDMPPGEPISDRTVLGDPGSKVVARLYQDGGWEAAGRMIRMQSYPRIEAHLVSTDLLSPLDARWPGRMKQIAALSAVQGLAGTVLVDTQPHGYEAKNPGMIIGSYSTERRDMWAFGYADPARLAFFDKYGIDPIDLPEPNLRTDLNLNTKFFPMIWNGEESAERLFEPWVQFRGNANEKALHDLRAAMKGEVWCDVRREHHAQPPRNVAVTRKWPAGAPPPTYADQYVQRTAGDTSVSFAEPTDPQFNDIVALMRLLSRPIPGLIAIDLCAVPAERREAVLSRAIDISGS